MSASEADKERARIYNTAQDYLTGEGIRVLDVNWKNTEGTLEIVADDRGTLVVVMLHTVSQPPKSTLKRQRRMAVAWMHAHGTRRDRIRVDTIYVTLLPLGQSNLEHVRAVDKDLS